MSNLKLCPFCGNEAIVCKLFGGFNYTTYRVQCTVCNAMMGTSKKTYYNGSKRFFETKQEAVDAWNRRDGA